MKNHLLLLLLFRVLVSVAQPSGVLQFNRNYENYPLSSFIDEIEKNNEVHFYFRPELIEGLKVTVLDESLDLAALLEKILPASKINYFISNSGNVYFFDKREMITKLPVYETIKVAKDDTESGNAEVSKYLEGRDANAKITLVIGEPGTSFTYKKVKVVGILKDAETGETLVGATLFIKESGRGAASDANGHITINLRQGTYSGVFQSLGMHEVKATIIVYSAGNFELEMNRQSQSIDEVLVTQTTERRGSNSGMESVNFLTMKEIPALLGEKDVMRIAQMLPGIVSVGEASGGINVRGGNADQNLFYVNNIPVYNSSHLFGFFSSINSNVVDKFAVYKGQVPVSYGGRLSSVFEVETRNGNKNKFFTEGAVSPISANIVLETPIIKEKASLSLSTRSTYSNWILGRMKDPELRNSQASFYDVSLGLDYSISDRDNLNVFGYYSNDYFSLNQLTDYSYGNSGASLNYTHRFNNKVKTSAYLINSNYRFGTIEQNVPVEAYQHDYSITHYEIKADVNWQPNETHDIIFGVNSILYQLTRGTIYPYGTESLLKEVPLGKETGVESALFLGDNISIGSRLKVYAGLRYSFYTGLGPKTVYLYNEGSEKVSQNIVDSIAFNSNESMVNYQGPEARAGLDFKTSINGTVKLTFTQMRQYLFMLSNTIAIAPTDQWKLSDYHIKPQSSIQYSVGYYHDFPMSGFLASAEVYRKQANNIVEYKDGADFLSTPNVETNILQGQQQSYGAEFMLSKEAGHLNGWITYTYSRSVITVDGEKEWEQINLGHSYASNYDKPHVMNLVLNYKFTRRFSLSSNVVYSSGRPITLPVGYYYIEGNPYIDYSARNEYRIPDYFRMDFSVKMEGNLKRRKAMHSYWMFSVYNATGRNNANSVFFKSEEEIVRGYKYSIIGVPIYTISWNWKLGNYENK
ncbi:MAG: carboxypeptidase-like regulatory domain-containing protein [Prolixibacteraceae bacterium]